MPYEPRTYRRAVEPAGLVTFEVVVAETDLQIAACEDLSVEATQLVESARSDIEAFIGRHPRFAETFVPFDPPGDAPDIVREMCDAASHAGVGPMASVAGAVAEHVARGLSGRSEHVIVENGGDVYLVGDADRTVALHAGASSLTGRVGIAVPAREMPLAVCTSSGTVGPSVSMGKADAACVVARSGALADAVASAVGNRVHSAEDIPRAIEAARGVRGVLGVVVVLGEHMGAWGSLQLVALG